MKRELTAICKRLNQHVPVKQKEDVDALNEICGEAFNIIKDFGIYFDRDLYINCDCDSDKCRDLVRGGGEVEFCVTEDYTEHPGVCVRYRTPNIDEHKFLELNSVLVKFWKDNNITSKTDRIGYLARMAHWYENNGIIIQD